MSDDFLNNLTALTDNMGDISFTRYVTVTNINNNGSVDCREDNGTVHKNVINSVNLDLSVGDIVLLSFVDNNIYNPVISGGVNVQNNNDGSSIGDLSEYVKKSELTTDYDVDLNFTFGMSGYDDTISIDTAIIEKLLNRKQINING